MGEAWKWRARWDAHVMVSMALALLAAGCGGGGGGGAARDSPPPAPAYEQARISVAELGACGVETARCGGMAVGDVFIDDAGEATLFWTEYGSSTQPGLHVASHRLGTGLGSRAHVFALAATEYADLRVLALGDKRFAVVNRAGLAWTSGLVDLSVASSPTVSPRVTTPLDNSAQLVSGFDGPFALGPRVPSGPIALGGAATAQGVNVQLPAGYRSAMDPLLQPPMGVTPAAWWAFSLPDSAGDLRVQLARVDLTGGNVTTVERSLETLRPRNSYHCRNTDTTPRLVVGEHELGQAVVGWLDHKLATAGCDVFVNGVALTGEGASANWGPCLGRIGRRPLCRLVGVLLDRYHRAHDRCSRIRPSNRMAPA